KPSPPSSPPPNRTPPMTTSNQPDGIALLTRSAKLGRSNSRETDRETLDKLIARLDNLQTQPEQAGGHVAGTEAGQFEAWARPRFSGSPETFVRIEARPHGWEYNGDLVQAAWAAWSQRAALTAKGEGRVVDDLAARRWN